MARGYLYTGKCEVGETTIAAATAWRSAELGYKTVVLSSDAAHSLADSFDITLSNELQPIAPNLWAQETSIYQTLATIQKWLAALLAWGGMGGIVAGGDGFFPWDGRAIKFIICSRLL